MKSVNNNKEAGGGPMSALGTRRSLLLLVVLAPNALGVPQCAEYVRRGYCGQEKYDQYMSRHCPDACRGPSGPAPQEDEACANWAAEGYCTHEQFVGLKTI